MRDFKTIIEEFKKEKVSQSLVKKWLVISYLFYYGLLLWIIYAILSIVHIDLIKCN